MSQFQNRKDQILERLSFEGFYRGEFQHLKLTADDNYQTLCPFHEDKNPSLSVNFKTGLFKCFGCGVQGDVFAFYMQRHGVDFKEALAELGRRAGVEVGVGDHSGYLSLRLKEFALAKRLPEDFLTQHRVKENRFPDGTVATDFQYLDAAGKLKAIRHRFANKDEKKFRWRKGDKVGFYGLWWLPEIIKAGWCLIVEGETDALTCRTHGLPVLGIPGKETWRRCWAGAGNAAFKKVLKEIPVWLWEEPDAGVRPPQQPKALLLREQVGQDMPGVKIIKAPAGIKDLSEAHCRGDDIKALVARLKKEARPPEPPPVIMEAFSLSDLGNSRRLVALHGQDLRYCHLNKKWYAWNGKYWAVDSTAEVERRAKLIIAELYREASECQDFKEREARGKFALQCEESRRILAMVRQAQSEPGVPILPAAFDAQPWLLNCANGTIDLSTGRLRPHAREDLLTCMSPVPFEPEAEIIEWEKFLYQIMDVRREPTAADRMVVFLQRAFGYAVTGATKEQCLFILWGGGANGKSTLLNLVKEVLGNYALNTPIETLLAKNRGGDIPTDVARLDGPRFVTASEVDRGRRLAESLVKELTGKDTISARFLYGEYFDFKPQFKLFLSTNNKPVIRGADDAIWRRLNMIKFNVQFGEGKDFPQDKDLEDKLRAEAPGILAWLVRGCLYWQQEGLGRPEEVTAANAEYRAEMDVLAEFIEDCCLVAPGLSATAQEIYSAYCHWAEEAGLKEKEIMKQRTFGICLTERGFKRDKGAAGKRFWRGVGLRSV